MKTHESGRGCKQGSRQRVRRMICQMMLRELRQEMARQQMVRQAMTKRMPEQAIKRMTQHRMKRALPVGMTSCRRMAAALQKMPSGSGKR